MLFAKFTIVEVFHHIAFGSPKCSMLPIDFLGSSWMWCIEHRVCGCNRTRKQGRTYVTTGRRRKDWLASGWGCGRGEHSAGANCGFRLVNRIYFIYCTLVFLTTYKSQQLDPSEIKLIAHKTTSQRFLFLRFWRGPQFQSSERPATSAINLEPAER